MDAEPVTVRVKAQSANLDGGRWDFYVHEVVGVD